MEEKNPIQVADRLFHTIELLAENGPMGLIDISKELEAIRIRGYAIDDEENEIGVKCVAVAIDDFMEKPRYAISISAPEIRMKEERMEELAKMLKETKAQIAEAWS